MSDKQPIEKKARRGRPSWTVTPENYNQVRRYISELTTTSDYRRSLEYPEKEAWEGAKFGSLHLHSDEFYERHPDTARPSAEHLEQESARLDAWINNYIPSYMKKIAQALRAEKHRQKHREKRGIDINENAWNALNQWKSASGLNFSEIIVALSRSVPESQYELHYSAPTEIHHETWFDATYTPGLAQLKTATASSVQWTARTLDQEAEIERVKTKIKELTEEITFVE